MENFYSIIIGVGADLPETVNDATAIKSVLTDKYKGGYLPENVFFLTEKQSTKDRIIKAFDTLIEKTKDQKDATVFIYYSGHGSRYYDQEDDTFSYYLNTFGSDISDKENTMLNGEIFAGKIDEIKSKQLLVLIDCCHAGGLKKSKLKLKNSAIQTSNRGLQEKLKSGKGRVYLSSCDDNETSVILPNAKNSLFTDVALEVLNGLFSPNSEYISAIDLVFHVLKEVPKRLEPFDHSQTPILTEAIELNHKYYVCRNGGYKKFVPDESEEAQTIMVNPLLDNKTGNGFNNFDFMDADINQFSKQNEQNMNELLKMIQFKPAVTKKAKVKLFNRIGGEENLGKLKVIIQDKNTHPIVKMNIENALNEDEKIQFIRNYTNKI